MNLNFLETATNAMGSWGIMIVYIVVIFGAMYFFMIRPNKKKQKEEESMRNNISVGDEILTIGGYYGKVVAVKEDSFVIECGPDRVKLRLAKWAIQQNFSLKAAEPKEIIKKEKKKPTEDKADK